MLMMLVMMLTMTMMLMILPPPHTIGGDVVPGHPTIYKYNSVDVFLDQL